MDKDSHLIIGFGEIGKALYNILKEYYIVGALDLKEEMDVPYKVDVIHIAIPYTDKFIDQVKEYQAIYKPKYTVIHSTIPVGTCSKLNAVHSPCRGLHPNLESGIRTFPKFLGGPDASHVAGYFRRAGIKVILFDKSETTEALKLYDTEYYRSCIEFAHRVKNFCDKQNLNFSEVYTIPNQTYNEGYTKLGYPEFVRPILQPIMTGKIGGHCVMPNSELIKLSE